MIKKKKEKEYLKELNKVYSNDTLKFCFLIIKK